MEGSRRRSGRLWKWNVLEGVGKKVLEGGVEGYGNGRFWKEWERRLWNILEGWLLVYKYPAR